MILFCNRDPRGPPVAVLQPSLKILEKLICPSQPKSKTNKDLTTKELYTVQPISGLTVDYRAFLRGDPMHTFDAWRERMPTINKSSRDPESTSSDDAESVIPPQAGSKKRAPRMFSAVLEQKQWKFRNAYLMDKYARKWRNIVS